jgi:hypothetical protein
VSRSVCLPLDPSVVVAGNVWLGERLLSAIRSSIVLSAIARLLAAGYLRSIDLIALFAQRAMNLVGLHRPACRIWEFRRDWRQWFEDKVCMLAQARILASVDAVEGFYRTFDYSVPPDLQEKLYARLIDALSSDTVLSVEMVELQKLPIGLFALKRRLLALDAGVERYIAPLAYDMVIGHFAFDDVASGGVQ